MTKLSFVIPCYKSEKTIGSVIDEITETMKKTDSDYDYEIILVNDASPDGVWNVIKVLAEQDKRVRGISFAQNFGQHAALMAGYRACEGDYIVSLDDDGQTPVNSVFLLINKLSEGFDVVFADYEDKKEGALRLLGSKINDVMTEKMLNKPKRVKMNSFYVMKRFIAVEMVKYENSYPYIAGLLLRCTKNIANIKVEHRSRLEGNSGYTFKKLISLWLNGFTAFSEKPLRIATVMGIIISCGGFIYGIYVVFRKIFNPTIQVGYSSLMAVLLFAVGVIMLLLGIIGEYIGRIYICINNAPQYVINERTDNKN